MITYTDGTRFNGRLEKGQVWVKGKIERKILWFNSSRIAYELNNRSVKVVPRRVFRRWLYSGAMVEKGES